jgi:putative transposase
MARPLRIQFPGGLYHVTARGNGRQTLFADDIDRERFLIVLTQVVARYRLLCHAHCLMGNHYHLLLETPDANLSRAMRQLNGVYSQAFNRRHERPGHVLEGRYHAQVVDKTSICARYAGTSCSTLCGPGSSHIHASGSGAAMARPPDMLWFRAS